MTTAGKRASAMALRIVELWNAAAMRWPPVADLRLGLRRRLAVVADALPADANRGGAHHPTGAGRAPQWRLLRLDP